MDRSVIRKPPIVFDGSCLDDPASSTSRTTSPADGHRRRRRYGIKGQWFTRPAYLGADATADPSLAGLPSRVQRSVNGLVDVPSSYSAPAERHHPDNVDELLRTYFPLTLMVSETGGPPAESDRDAADVRTASGATPSGSRSTSGRRRSRTSTGGRRSRPSSIRSSSSSASNGSLDRIYLTSNDVSADILGNFVFCRLVRLVLQVCLSVCLSVCL